MLVGLGLDFGLGPADASGVANSSGVGRVVAALNISGEPARLKSTSNRTLNPSDVSALVSLGDRRCSSPRAYPTLDDAACSSG